MALLILLSFILMLIDGTVGHITLTFPPARYPPLDFLDTARTIGPCGLPKSDRSAYSTFQTNTNYNVTWRLQYPHQGGYKLYLIDYTGNVVEHLAPDKPVSEDQLSTNNFDGLDEQSAESRVIQFHTSCPNCTLVLERQALEWGPSYKFRSCSEVHITEGVVEPINRMCLNGGEWKNDECECPKKTSGKFCQYKDDCDTNDDCLNGGKCLVDGIFPNKKSCFCVYGFFGPTCKEESSAAYAEDDCFRHLGNTTIPPNFKYGMFDEKCYKQFDIGNGDFIWSRTVKDQAEIIMDYATESYVSLGWRPLQIPKTCRLFPDLSKGKSDSRQGGTTSGFLQSTLDSSLHPMDCTDIVMASVVDNDFLHIEDMYTRDRSTPLNDDLLDGEQSLTAAYGLQQDGRTVVMFRRGIREIEPSDHPLGPGQMHVIHAKGQTQGSYKHSAPSALEKKQTVKTDFYKNDQWRYHGSQNRGVQVLEFVSAVEMRFKGPLMHLADGSPAPPLGKVLERPPPQTQFREQVIPRPDSGQPHRTDEDPSSTSAAPTSLIPPQITVNEEPSPTPEPEPEPEPRLTVLHKSNEHHENVVEEPSSLNGAQSSTTDFLTLTSTLFFLQIMLRLCQTFRF